MIISAWGAGLLALDDVFLVVFLVTRFVSDSAFLEPVDRDDRRRLPFSSGADSADSSESLDSAEASSDGFSRSVSNAGSASVGSSCATMISTSAVSSSTFLREDFLVVFLATFLEAAFLVVFLVVFFATFLAAGFFVVFFVVFLVTFFEVVFRVVLGFDSSEDS